MSLNPNSPDGILKAHAIMSKACRGAMKSSRAKRQEAVMSLWKQARSAERQDLLFAAAIIGIWQGVDHVANELQPGVTVAASAAST